MNSSLFFTRKKYAESVDTILHMSINRNNEISLPVDRVIFDESLHRAFFCFFYIQSEILSYQIENIGVGIGQITHEINRISFIVILDNVSLKESHQFFID